MAYSIGLWTRWSAVSIAFALLSACGSVPDSFNQSDIATHEVASVTEVFVATTRKRSDDAKRMFSDSRSSVLNFAELQVGIPETHRPGRVESSRRSPDPKRHFTLTGRQNIESSTQFRGRLNDALKQLPTDKRELLIFVHGFNNNFASGVFRHAQMTHDFGVPAVALHYSWPSAGRTDGYVYDRDSAIFAREGLANALKLAASTNATNITLLAHSMGSLLTLEALNMLALSRDAKTLRSIDTVILAAPDVDIDVFDAKFAALHKFETNEFVILVSGNDGALGLSSTLRGGHPRVGQGRNNEALQQKGIVVVDVSQIDGGGHSTFAASPKLIQLIESGALEETIISSQTDTATSVIVDGAGDAGSLLVLLPKKVFSRR